VFCRTQLLGRQLQYVHDSDLERRCSGYESMLEQMQRSVEHDSKLQRRKDGGRGFRDNLLFRIENTQGDCKTQEPVENDRQDLYRRIGFQWS
jgi:hypothetical protein